MSVPKLDIDVEKNFSTIFSTIGNLNGKGSTKELLHAHQKIQSIIRSLRSQFARLNPHIDQMQSIYYSNINHAIKLTYRNIQHLKKASTIKQDNDYNILIDSVRTELLQFKCEVLVEIPEPKTPSKQSLKSIQVITPNVFYNFHLKTPGLFAHLAIDSMLDTLEKDLTTLHDNVTLNKLLKFFIDALDIIPREYPQEFNAQDMENFELIRSKFQKTSRLQEYIEYYETIANRTPDQNQDALNELSKLLLENLNNLAPGETFPLLWGWKKQGSAGHRMIIEFKKNSTIYLLKVLTTGAGGQYHSQENNGASDYLDVVSEYRVSHEELFSDLAQCLFEPLIFFKCTDVMDKNDVYSEKTVYTILRPYAIPLPEHIEKINIQKKEQLSGTCISSVLVAYICHKSPKGNLFKNLLERLCVKLYFRNFSSRQSTIFDPLWQFALSRVIPNLYRHLEKDMKNSISNDSVNVALQELSDFQNEI